VNDKTESRNHSVVLSLDGVKIPADGFVRAVDSFFGILASVTRAVGDRSFSWDVSVRPGSAEIIANADLEGIDPVVLERALDVLADGFSTLEREPLRPAYFDDSALRKIHNLASVIVPEGGIDSVKILIDGRRQPLSHSSVTNVNVLIGSPRTAYGTVEGRLQMLSERGGLRFVIYDSATDKAIRCLFEEEMLDEIASAFRKRVLVYGKIRYRLDGTTTSVHVERFEVFPEVRDLPSAKDVKGILGR
jgi:hypothetical protein